MMMLNRILCVMGFMALTPGASQAISIQNIFLGSSSGTAVVTPGDTIRFEVLATTVPGVLYDTGSMTLASDITGAILEGGQVSAIIPPSVCSINA